MLCDILALDRRLVEIIEVINDRHLPTAFGKHMVDEMRADETSAAGDQDASHLFLVRYLHPLFIGSWSFDH
jgi:hypothetical protein